MKPARESADEIYFVDYTLSLCQINLARQFSLTLFIRDLSVLMKYSTCKVGLRWGNVLRLIYHAGTKFYLAFV